MKTFKLTYHEGGTTHYKFVKASNRDEALQIGWSLTDAESIYVEEVTNEKSNRN